MRCVTIVRTLVVRAVFCVHGLLAVTSLYVVMKDARYWYLLFAIALLVVETIVILTRNRGKEWKWFCPSVLIYLISVVPSIWFLELYNLDIRITCQRNNITNPDCRLNPANTTFDHKFKTKVDKIIPILTIVDNVQPTKWAQTLEQLLLLILIVCRWIMPKGKLTHDQLSQLLLVYIGTAADIVEFFEAFKEEKVMYNRALCISILGIWSFSLLQFCLVLTAAKARQDKTGLLRPGKWTEKNTCCQADVFAIIISIVLQDMPFLVFRMLLILQYDVLSYTNMFFTSKNTLVIALLIYRLVVVHIHRKKEHIPEISHPYDGRCSSNDLRENLNVGPGSDASSTKSQLMNRSSMSFESVNRLNDVSAQRSVGLIKSIPRAWTRPIADKMDNHYKSPGYVTSNSVV